MEDTGEQNDRRLTRRTLIKGAVAAGGALAGAGATIAALEGGGGRAARPRPRAARPAPVARQSGRPNILVVIVDQLRYPQWASPTLSASGFAPEVQRLREGAVSFARHYTASNDCTPARATLLTGLYTHQTGCMITGGSTLDPGFPTYGGMLREQGYSTRWYGKWHLTHHDNLWRARPGARVLERYGFSGGTFPSPDGAPGQGMRVDPHIAGQFAEWLARDGEQQPWCATVSLVNPHDIAWWYVWSNRVAAEASAASVVGRLPPNFETPEQLVARRKPRLHRSLQATAAASFGPVPFHGPEADVKWRQFMDLYMKLQLSVDRHVGNVLAALAAQPRVAANTVVIFTSDHGEYAASHGLRGKGAGVYEEGIRVPLIVRDPRGELTAETDVERTQLTSSVDFPGLLLTIATGGREWRNDPRYEHLAQRQDLAAILAAPGAPGRPYVRHATDEIVTEFAAEQYAAAAPLHVAAIRTAAAKYATYTHWYRDSLESRADGAEAELYEYATHDGRMEIENLAGSGPNERHVRGLLEHAVTHELREPLPRLLRGARGRGLNDYFSTAKRDALGAAAARRRRTERVVGPLRPGDTAGDAGDLSVKP